MSFSKETATGRAKQDLAERLNLDTDVIDTASVCDQDFPDMSLGAPAEGEMSAQMISSGWKINLSAENSTYEYRADKYQLRLVNFKGANHIIVS